MKKISTLWLLALFVVVLSTPGASSFAQGAKTNQGVTQNGDKQIKSSTNLNPQLRQNARKEVAAAAAARAQADRRYKIYLDAVNQHKKDVQQFVKNKKDGVR